MNHSRRAAASSLTGARAPTEVSADGTSSDEEDEDAKVVVSLLEAQLEGEEKEQAEQWSAAKPELAAEPKPPEAFSTSQQ